MSAEDHARARKVFEQAVITNNQDMVLYVLQKEQGTIDINQNFVTDTEELREAFPLLLASECGNEKMAELFLRDHEAEVNKQDPTGFSALMVASQHGNKRLVQLLLKYKADVNLENNTGQTALMFASYFGYAEIVEFFLNETEASVDKTNKNGMTALMLAICNGHIDVVRQLRPKSFKLNCQLVVDVSALDIAMAKGHHDKLIGELAPKQQDQLSNPCDCLLRPEELARILDIIVRDSDRNDSNQTKIKDSDQILVPTVDIAFRLFSRISKMWQNIALHLKVSDEVIQDIAQRTDTCTQDCLRECLRVCFEKERPTWESLEEVIDNVLCDDKSERDKLIEQLHLAAPKEESNDTCTTDQSSENSAHQKLDLREALRATYKLAARWYNFGVFLGVDASKLDTIKKDETLAEDCLRETLKTWLQMGKANWKDLCIAVDCLNHSLSQDIATTYNVSMPES